MKQFNDEELKKKLTPDQYRILREKGTEAPFSGKFLNHKEDGMYNCAVCGAGLFDSKTKFDSGTGWPSFYDAAKSDAIDLREDTSHGMSRLEATCANCGSHLGHVFKDAHDQPTGTRYCINSACLGFVPSNENKNTPDAKEQV
ncbi:peptide-methionine (R)-S-oxide reductase MsrB [Candidatus Saccharibacteria bacterium]|nr:peptide-methionine (R)-S-oxide reductase MsrB [Candidatus Saccharibacteria bacterium]